MLFSSPVFSDDLGKKAFEAIKQTKEYQDYIKARDELKKSDYKPVVAPFMMEAVMASWGINELGDTKKHQTYKKAKEAIKQIIESATKNTKEYETYIKSNTALENTKEYQIYEKAKNDFLKTG